MKEIIYVKGMHCRSCEVLIEDKVKAVSGVKKVFASTKKKIAVVYGEDYDRNKVVSAIQGAGYEVGQEDLPFVTKNRQSLLDLFLGILIALSLVWLFGVLNIEKILTPSSFAGSNYAVIFVIGITAGLSTCMALVGGLVLGISARHAEKHPEASPLQNFRPHIFFNLGRILIFFVLGGIVGQLGAIFKISNVTLGIITILVGLVMLVLGIQLTEMFPRFSNFLTLPKFFSKIIGTQKVRSEYGHFKSFLLGGLTFFLPCGFTQAMQVYAVSTGSFLSGALIMSVFALGTTPGLLSVGGLASVIKKGSVSGLFFKTIGALLVILAFYNISNGASFSGLNLEIYNPTEKQESQSSSAGPINPADVQLVKATYSPDNVLTPNEFNVNAGKPVRFEVFAEEDGQGCMGSVMITGLVNEPQFFQKGKTVIFEFTPKKSGKYKITCAMGIKAGTINVQ